MTPEALRNELQHGTEESLVILLAGASEKERKAASQVVMERIDRDLKPLLGMGLTVARARHIAFQFPSLDRKVDYRPHLALCGTGTFGDLKRYLGPVPARVYDVLAARRPKWLPDWCRWALKSTHTAWPVVRRLVRDGLCERPETDEYYLLMVHCGGRSSAKDLLESDPALLEHEVWELFRREGTREASLENSFGGWSEALVELSAEGRVCRKRLLDASLEALELPFKAHHTTWYRNFHEALQPTVDERTARLRTYLGLTASAVPATVKFALAAVARVEKAGELPLEPLLEAAGMALAGKEKGTASTVLRLLDRAAKAHPECRPRVAAVAAAAFEHPAADVQAGGLDVIERLGPLAPETARLIEEKLAFAGAPVRERAQRYLGESPAVDVAERYEPHWTRLDPLVHAKAIEPIEDLEQLVLTMSRVMQQGGPPDDVERVLDGLSRLCHLRPPRFDDLTSSLRAEAGSLSDPAVRPSFPGVFSVPFCMSQLVAAWLFGRQTIALTEGPYLLHAALGVRPYWVAFRAIRRQPRALLSAPTHSGGWIDPLVLASRLRQGTSGAGDREYEADLRQAVHRLPPGEHALPPEVSALIPTAPRRACQLLWGRLRYQPDVVRASLQIEPPPARDLLRPGDVFAAETQPLSNGTPQLYEADPVLRGLTLGPDLVAWSAQMWPSQREDWCTLGAFRIANNLDWQSAVWANRAFLGVFDDPSTEMGPMAYLLLSLGLMAKEATEAAIAAHGLRRLIEDGRLDCGKLGAALAGLFASGVVRGSRLSKALTDTARAGRAHADAVRQILERALAGGMPPRPADQSALLEAFLEACTASGVGPQSESLRGLLAAVSGGGKGPKLARSLLALGSEHVR